MSVTVKDQQYTDVGEATVVGFTATDQYDERKAAPYWFDGDLGKVVQHVEGKRNPYRVLPLAIVHGHIGVQYAMARHVEDGDLALQSVGEFRVDLFRGEDDRYWFCLCKPGSSGGASVETPAPRGRPAS